MSENLKVIPSTKPGYVMSLNCELMKIPNGWKLLKPGDATLTRRVKKDSPTWTIEVKKGKRTFSQGILAPAHRIDTLQAELLIEREDPSYQKRLDASRARRAKQEQAYQNSFTQAVLNFLQFHDDFLPLAADLAEAITTHAVPVGSGTVARTKTISIEQRAEAATIAWLRHQTTAYDHMTIPKGKGKRRETRRNIAKKSRQILQNYRLGKKDYLPNCPLYKALNKAN